MPPPPLSPPGGPGAESLRGVRVADEADGGPHAPPRDVDEVLRLAQRGGGLVGWGGGRGGKGWEGLVVGGEGVPRVSKNLPAQPPHRNIMMGGVHRFFCPMPLTWGHALAFGPPSGATLN